MSTFGTQTTSELIENVKRRGFIPDAQNTLDDNDIIKFLNEEMYDSLVPLILQYHEEYFTFIDAIPLIPDQSNYKIPYRALGRKIRDIKYRDTNGSLFSMTRILPEDRSYFQDTGFNPFKAFYFQGDEIILIPGVGSTPVGDLVVSYFMRPNTLVIEDRCSSVLSFDLDTGIITVDTIPAMISVGSKVDFVEFLPGNKLMAFDVPIMSVDPVNNTITIDIDDIPSNLSVNDYINVAGEACVAQVPTELQSLLAERGAARCLASLGQNENLQNSNSKIAELEQKSGSLIDNRSEGTPLKVNNLSGILRQSKISKRRFYF